MWIFGIIIREINQVIDNSVSLKNLQKVALESY